ncbi:MAG: rhomboid family intramembrane serine protease [Oligoflexia bacterium]|nr:rhomboid family intramembrane serine protease [Oligoflexia bacterium]
MLIEVKRRGHVQRMTYEEFEQRIIEGDIRAQTPVHFELVTGDGFLPAGDLELFQALADPSLMAFRRNLSHRGMPIVTAVLVGVQLRIYLASWAPDSEEWLQDKLMNWAPAILEQGEVWRMMSYGLLHIWFPHLLFNMLFLVYSGYHLERSVGRANLLLIYFGSVLTGGMLSMAMSMDRPSLGASGGVFGMLAAGVVVGWKYWEAIPVRARKYFGGALAWYIGYSLLSGLRSEGTDNWSHLGGLLGGGLIMTILEPQVFAARARANRITRGAIVTVLAAATLAIGLAGPRLVPLTRVDEDGWSLARPDYWKEGWTFTGDRGWFSPTLDANLSAATTVHPRPPVKRPRSSSSGSPVVDVRPS